MGQLRRLVVKQFARPSGLLGRFAGHIMAIRPSNRERSAWTIKLVAPKPGERLLEIGCGPGVAMVLCTQAASDLHLTGLDHSPVMLRQARARLARKAPGADWNLVEGAIDTIAGWPDPFDAIWSVNVIQFVADLEETFRRLHDMLNPAGRIVTTYQPRHTSPTRADALAMADRICEAMRSTGFTSLETHVLDLKPAPAVAVTGLCEPG